MLARQRKQNKLSTPFDPRPFRVMCKKDTMITACRSGKYITCNTSQFKILSSTFPEIDVKEQDDVDAQEDYDISESREQRISDASQSSVSDQSSSSVGPTYFQIWLTGITGIKPGILESSEDSTKIRNHVEGNL